MRSPKTFQRIAFLAVVLAAMAFVYLRPLTVVYAARDAYLYAIGMRDEVVHVQGHRIHYYSGGEGPPLVVVHGVASRAADGALLYRDLMQTRRVYALDLLGFGESDKPATSDYSVPTQAEIVRGFMDAVGVAEADVMGVSMGGWIALKVAAEHPRRVRKLVLVSSAGLQFPSTLTETSFSPANLEELRASLALQTDNASKIPEFVLRDLLRRSSSKELIVRRSMRSMLTPRDTLDGKLHHVTMPVLLVWGTNDRIVPFALATRMQKEMPQAQLVTLAGCGHLGIVECRSRAMPAIVAFLAGARQQVWSAEATASAFQFGRQERDVSVLPRRRKPRRTKSAALPCLAPEFESGGTASALHKLQSVRRRDGQVLRRSAAPPLSSIGK